MIPLIEKLNGCQTLSSHSCCRRYAMLNFAIRFLKLWAVHWIPSCSDARLAAIWTIGVMPIRCTQRARTCFSPWTSFGFRVARSTRSRSRAENRKSEVVAMTSSMMMVCDVNRRMTQNSTNRWQPMDAGEKVVIYNTRVFLWRAEIPSDLRLDRFFSLWSLWSFFGREEKKKEWSLLCADRLCIDFGNGESCAIFWKNISVFELLANRCVSYSTEIWW